VTSIARRLPAALLTAAVLVQGCGAARAPRALGSEARASLGTVAVCSVAGAPRVRSQGLVGRREQAARDVARREGSRAGASAGASAGAAAGSACGPFSVLCSPVFALYGAAIGGVSGAVSDATGAAKATPTDAAGQAAAALAAAVADGDVQAALRRRVLEVANATAAGWIDLGSIAAASGSGCAAHVPGGAETVLQLSVVRLGFVGRGSKDPGLALTIGARASLVEVATGRVIWADDEIAFRGDEARLSQWTADDALVPSELARGVAVLGRRIAVDVLPAAPSGSMPAH